MPSVDIDLGSLEMKSKASGLRLRMTSEATFAVSAKDDVDALYEGLTSPELNNSLNRPWIICDNTFKLKITLHLEHEPTPASRDDLVNILSERLRLSKTWSKIGLTAHSIQCATSESGCHTVEIDLAIRDDKSKPAKRKLHKLGIPPQRDIRAPVGICTASLERVYIQLCVQRIERPQRKSSKRLRSEIGFQRSTKESALLISAADTGTCLGLTSPANSHPALAKTVSPDLRLDESHCLHESGDEDITHAEETMLLDIDDDDANMDAVSYLNSTRTPLLLKRNSSTANLEVDEPVTNNGETLDLLDAAIRMSISDCRRNLPKTISLTGTESLKYLEGLAPSVWRPEFLQAMASRTSLMPTISHALNTTCFRNSGLGPVRNNGDAAQNDTFGGSDNSRRRSNLGLASTDVSVRLWQRLQKAMHVRTATSKLTGLFRTDILATDMDNGVAFHTTREHDACGSTCGNSEGEADEDLFLEDDVSSLSDGECDFDLFDDEEMLFLEVVTADEADVFEASADKSGTNLDHLAVSTKDWRAARSDDEMLSICESLGSLPLSEDCFNFATEEELSRDGLQIFEHGCL